MLKRRLETSQGDLQTVVNTISHLIHDTIAIYRQSIGLYKARCFSKWSIPVMKELNYGVSPHAQKKIYEQWLLIKDLQNPWQLDRCKGLFRKVIGLPYKHEIFRRIHSVPGRQGVLYIEDVHQHWLYNPRRRTRDTLRRDRDDDDSHSYVYSPFPVPYWVYIREPAVKRSNKGRPKGSTAAKKRQKARDNSTKRLPSKWEVGGPKLKPGSSKNTANQA